MPAHFIIFLLKLFRPWPYFNVRGPCAAMLAVQVEINLSDGVRVETTVGTALG
jgi:hypothetical protein